VSKLGVLMPNFVDYRVH